MKTRTPREARQCWIDCSEIALIDVREEGPYSEAHPLFAITIPVSELEDRLPHLVPRKSASIVLYDDGEGYVERAVRRTSALGYTDVSILEGGLSGYAGFGEIYRDVNVPSKAFGELVESIRHTPSMPAAEVRKILDSEDDVVVVDARRYEEFNTMSIPCGQSCPGGELVYRIGDAAPSPETLVIVNCAGRTRSIIGTQSLINAGIPNKVIALRNGTIGWALQDLDLDRRKTGRVPEPSAKSRSDARKKAEKWAEHVGVKIIGNDILSEFREEVDVRTLYTLDVRDPDEYSRGHPAGFVSAPGGQLVQAVDEWVGVRGARIVLYDTDGVRARMAASWLYQMGWDVYVLEEGAELPETFPLPATPRFNMPKNGALSVSQLQEMNDVAIVDLARSPVYKKGHIKGAYFASGPEIVRDLKVLLGSGPVVLTSTDGSIAAANIIEANNSTKRQVFYLSSGTAAWIEAGLPLETECRYLSSPIDVYKRPYEGTDNAKANMQSYIDWELQLVAQLANDGVSRFRVVRAPESR